MPNRFAVVVSCIPWCVDERRVSGVAVMRHSVFVVSSLLVDAVDEHRKRHLCRYCWSGHELLFDGGTPAHRLRISSRRTRRQLRTPLF